MLEKLALKKVYSENVTYFSEITMEAQKKKETPKFSLNETKSGRTFKVFDEVPFKVDGIVLKLQGAYYCKGCEKFWELTMNKPQVAVNGDIYCSGHCSFTHAATMRESLSVVKEETPATKAIIAKPKVSTAVTNKTVLSNKATTTILNTKKRTPNGKTPGIDANKNSRQKV